MSRNNGSPESLWNVPLMNDVIASRASRTYSVESLALSLCTLLLTLNVTSGHLISHPLLSIHLDWLPTVLWFVIVHNAKSVGATDSFNQL